jgi:predicted transcriptional regulator
MHPWGSSFASTSSKRRDKLYIVAEILEIVRDGVLKTQIMYRANLSFTQLNEYLKFMLKNELIEKIPVNEKEVYKATEKGLDFLQRYRDITELLREENNNIKNNMKIPPPHLLRRN